MNAKDILTDTDAGLSQNEAADRLKKYGYNEIPEKRAHPIVLLFKKLWNPSAWMLESIIVISFILHKNTDAYIVLVLLFVNTAISFGQDYSASNVVDTLKRKLRINVKILRDKVWKTVPARELVPGDVIRVRAGDFVPADINIAEGEINVDQSALTGESGDKEKHTGDVVYSGSMVSRGEAMGIVVSTGARTNFGKTIELVKTSRPKSHNEEVIYRMVERLLIIVSIMLLVAFIVSWVRGINLLEILPLMLVLLVGAVPVALSVMFSVSMALSSKQLVKEGVLVTRMNTPNDAAIMDVLCVDKTGTLTMNRLSIAATYPSEGFTENDVLLYGALASEEANHDSIDMAFINPAKEKVSNYGAFAQEEFIPFTPENRKTEAVIKSGNDSFRVLKGSFDAIAEVCDMDGKSVEQWTEIVNDYALKGYRTLAIGKTVPGDKPRLVGLAALYDPPREDSKKLIEELHELGVSVKMLTGDALPVAREIAKMVGLGDSIISAAELRKSGTIPELLEKCDGVAEVYPEDKHMIVKALQSSGHIVGMTGDGVNDAPALKQAEVGVAVSNATDAAKDAASVVLTEEGLSGIILPIRIGRKMFERINTWVLVKIASTIFKTCFIVIAFLVLGKYVITVPAMLLIILMTDFVKIFLATDNVKATQKPDKWEINKQAYIGTIFGLIITVEALALFYLGVHYFNVSVESGILNSFSFLTFLFFILLSIFSLREKSHFWSSQPSRVLLLTILADMILGVSIANLGILGIEAVPMKQILFIFVYALFFSLGVNDFIKYMLMRGKYPIYRQIPSR